MISKGKWILGASLGVVMIGSVVTLLLHQPDSPFPNGLLFEKVYEPPQTGPVAEGGLTTYYIKNDYRSTYVLLNQYYASDGWTSRNVGIDFEERWCDGKEEHNSYCVCLYAPKALHVPDKKFGATLLVPDRDRLERIASWLHRHSPW